MEGMVNPMTKLRCVIAAGAWLVLSSGALAQIYDFKDTTVTGNDPAVIDVHMRQNDDGGDPDESLCNYGLLIGEGYARAYPDVDPPAGKLPRHQMYRFDVSSILPGSTVTLATFNLFFSANAHAPQITDYKLSPFKPGVTWIEGLDGCPANAGEPAWAYRASPTAWDAAGASGPNDIDDTKTVLFAKSEGTAPSSEWVSVDVASIVQYWVDNPSDNNGMLMHGGYKDSSGTGYWNIVFSEHSTIDLRPYLHVEIGTFPPDIDPVYDSIARDGVPYTVQCTTSGGTPPVTWSLEEGPTGADIDDNGLISGWTPTSANMGRTYTFEVKATNDYGIDTESWEVRVPWVGWNNGFFSDYVYVIWNGVVRYHDENDLSYHVGDLSSNDWVSLSFSGAGENDDARLFGIKPSGTIVEDYWCTDFTIEELNSSGTIIQSESLTGLINGPPAFDEAPIAACIRYSSFHDTLFIGVNKSRNAPDPATVYEVDLDLTTVLNVYEGANTNMRRRLGIALNSIDGTLYMINRYLGGGFEANDGDLIAIDTSGGSTSLYTTLIDGTTYRAGDPRWNGPGTCVFRRSNPDDGTPTILICASNDDKEDRDVLEFYLDTTAHPPQAPDNNLVLRGSPIALPRGWNGQQDEVTDAVWIANDNTGTRQRRAFAVVEMNDETAWFDSNDAGWNDIDSPQFTAVPCHIPFADVDSDSDVDQDDFAVVQICFTGPGGGILSEPDYCRCLDRQTDGGAPGEDDDVDAWDVAAFEACATGPDVPFDEENVPPGCLP